MTVSGQDTRRPFDLASVAVNIMGPFASSRCSSICIRLFVLAIGALVFGFLLAAPAHAENGIASSNPADGASLESSPTSLLLTFTEALGPANTVLASCNGAAFSIGSPSVSADGLSLNVAVPNPMPKGTCNVSATVSAPDSTPNGSASFSFTITSDPVAVAVATTVPADTTPGTAADGTVTTTPAPAVGSAAEPQRVGGPLGLSRLIATLGLAVLFGSLVLIVTAWPEGVEYILTVRFLRTAWIVSLVGSVLTVIFLTAQVTGKSVGASISPLTWGDLSDSTPGLAALARVGLAAACGWVILRPERCIDQATQLPSLALPALAVATFGFSRTGGDLAALGVAVGIAHALAMAIWLGGIVLLTRVVLAGPGEDDLVHAVRGFGRISTPALLATVLTGAAQTFRLDRGTLFSTGHGRVLLLKAIAAGAMVFVGLMTRQFVQRRLRKVDAMTAPLASRLRRATGIEAVGGVIVLALTAWLLSLAPGGLEVDAADRGQYGYTQGRIVDGDLEVTVYLTSVVGANGVRVEVVQPESGLTSLVIRFIPPPDSGAAEVVLTVPPALAGTGVAVLPVAEGVPLAVPGVWTLQVSATTPTGEHTAQKTFTLLG